MYIDHIAPQPAYLLRVLLVYLNDLLHFVEAAHEDTGPVVDVFGHNCQHTLHSSVDRLAAGCNQRTSALFTWK